MPFVRRSVAVQLSSLVKPADMGRLFAAKAREVRDALIAEGRAPAMFETFVDGRAGAAEETVRVPDGVILYRFNVLGEAAAYALAYAQSRSPVRGGEYRASWIVLVDGRLWTGSLRSIPAGMTVAVTNTAPYHRKIDAGGQRTIGQKIVEETRQATAKRFPILLVERQFWTLPGGYVLKGHRRTRPATRAHRTRVDRMPGQPLTYPTIVISVKP